MGNVAQKIMSPTKLMLIIPQPPQYISVNRPSSETRSFTAHAAHQIFQNCHWAVAKQTKSIKNNTDFFRPRLAISRAAKCCFHGSYIRMQSGNVPPWISITMNPGMVNLRIKSFSQVGDFGSKCIEQSIPNSRVQVVFISFPEALIIRCILIFHPRYVVPTSSGPLWLNWAIMVSLVQPSSQKWLIFPANFVFCRNRAIGDPLTIPASTMYCR